MPSHVATSVAEDTQPRLFGHPTGLFTLFFAEMWERFSYYGMRALLVFYMIKGFLGFTDDKAYSIYGAYTALVYATPFIGGILADKFLGPRKAVVLGGVLMALGHLTMTIESEIPFFLALAMLIVGNGFFKPNISTIVGDMYPPDDSKRDGGFTIFYMGINLGAAAAPLLCGYVGETFGWHYGFGLATIGMLVGLAVFIAPTIITQLLIMSCAGATAYGMVALQDNPYTLAVNAFVAAALVLAAVIAFRALGKGGLDPHAGEAPEGVPSTRNTMYALGGSILAIPLLAYLVYQHSLAGAALGIVGAVALGYIIIEMFRGTAIERSRLGVVLVLMFFSMLFWAFFEQAGSSITNFTDRNVDRVFEQEIIAESQVGETLDITLSSAQLGHTHNDEMITITVVDGATALVRGLEAKAAGEEISKGDIKTVAKAMKAAPLLMKEVQSNYDAGKTDPTIAWTVAAEDVGMGVQGSAVPATTFQSANPIYILLFGLPFSALWSFLGARKLDPPAPMKFALGLLQLGLGFGALWMGAQGASELGMVSMGWILLGYLLHTTGELCLSPVGLSMVTKLSPPRLVSTIMGAWFLATAFSNYIAALIAKLTGVGGHGGGEEPAGILVETPIGSAEMPGGFEGISVIPAPVETAITYGDVFGLIALCAMGSAVLLFALSPVLTKAMHMSREEMAGGGGH